MAIGFLFIRSQRGKNKLVSEGYIYQMDRVHREKSYWVYQQPDCKGRCIQTANELNSTQEHNHCPDSAAIEVSLLSFLLSVSVGECR